MNIGKVQLFVRDALHTTVCDIVFIKADGSTRNMKATLQESILEGLFFPKEEIQLESVDRSSEFVQRIVDLEINEWRSFCWDRLVSVNGVSVESI